MKKHIITILLIAVTFSTFAQKKERHERIQALKVAFITEKLELTPKEAEQFWPVYNAIEEQKDALRKEAYKMRKELDVESLTDAQANTLLKDILALENRKHNLQNKKINDLLKVIPAKKIILLKVAEDQFNRRMMEEWKKRREKNKKDTP